MNINNLKKQGLILYLNILRAHNRKLPLKARSFGKKN
jgi:hypothetical protein